MKPILIALQFLTRLPIKVKEVAPEDLARSMTWFPLVGLLIGLFLYLINLEANIFNLAPEITAGLLVLALTIFTGGLHLDGLSDTADGFYAGKTREETLEIMHDSHTGVMGVIAIVLALILKYGIIISLLKGTLFNTQTNSLLVIPAVSRWGMVMAGALLPPARMISGSGGPARSEGLGQSFITRLKPTQWIMATIITGLIAMGLMPHYGFIVCLTGLLVVILSVIYIKQRIGGLTGDTLGAINEIIEVSGLFTAYILTRC
jgi:adenosylcobinamide-GDP ribazoletransferase